MLALLDPFVVCLDTVFENKGSGSSSIDYVCECDCVVGWVYVKHAYIT